MFIRKVLIQWLPTQDLRDERYLTMGGKWATTAQQQAVDAARDIDLFCRALALAEKRSDGLPVLGVGFTGSVRAYDGGWRYEGREEDVRCRYDETPATSRLVDEAQAWAKRAADDPMAWQVAFDRRVARVRRIVESELAASAERQRVATKEYFDNLRALDPGNADTAQGGFVPITSSALEEEPSQFSAAAWDAEQAATTSEAPAEAATTSGTPTGSPEVDGASDLY